MLVCYSRATHYCSYGKYLCALNNDVCAGFCINQVDADCINSPTSSAPEGGVLCGRGLGLCGTICYDQVVDTCNNGVLEARSVSASQLLCNNQPYNPSTSTCCESLGNNSNTTVCAKNLLCCVVGGNVSCYNPQEQYCCPQEKKLCAAGDINCCPPQN